jgi:nitric oxide reductase subunit B
MFIIASGIWNFVGAGVLGFFINLPFINYFEHGTYLTVAHGHAAMFGAFGFLALGMVTYMLRIAVPERKWSETNLRRAFWAWNVGLALMVGISLLPVGFLQLEVAFTRTYDAARSLAFYEGDLIRLLFWLRMPGDTLVILGTAIFGYDVVEKVLARGETTPADRPADAPVAASSTVETDD